MPFNRPSLKELADRARTDYSSRLPGADSRLRRSTLDVMARTQAGGFHGLYGYLDHIARQALPDTAEGEVLRRWAADFGVQLLPATAALGMVDATGINGSVVPTGALLQRADGVEYVVLADAVIAGGVAQAAVEAVEAGAAGLADAGVRLTFVSPIAGVSSTATVAAGGLGGGADEEDEDALRVRLLERLRDPPHGGNARDYVRWAKTVAGVTRVWVYPLRSGLGTVGVTFVLDDRADIIPGPADLAAVVAAIAAERPVTAEVTVFAPTPVPLDIDISLTPDTPAVRNAVLAELRDLVARDAQPEGTILISRIREAVSIAAGETDNVVNSPTANVAHGAGEMAVLGAVTF